MKLTRRLQLGLLFTLYLTRSGRTTLASAAEGLQVSPSFLEQVANSLRKFGVVKSFKGPTGGYELVGEPRVVDVFDALAPLNLIRGGLNFPHIHEQRALQQLALSMRGALTPILSRKLKNIGMDVVSGDMARMDRLSPTARGN